MKKFCLFPGQLQHPITIQISPEGYEKYIDPDRDTYLKKTLLLHIRAERVGADNYQIYGQFEGELITHCSRCMEEAIITEYQAFKHLFSYSEYHNSDDQSEEDNITYYQTVDIDIFELSRDELLLNIPDYLLCNKDCRGLCPVCGGNLNKMTCNHL